MGLRMPKTMSGSRIRPTATRPVTPSDSGGGTTAPRRAAPLPLLLFLLIGVFALLVLAPAGDAQAQATTDYDADDDNLIEVSTLEQLNAIRYDLDGNGDPDNSSNDTNYFGAFTGTGTDLSCNGTCTGYELNADLDFNSAASYASGSTNTSWTSSSGWEPIGLFHTTETSQEPYEATFEGNRHTISNLFINRTGGTTSNDGYALFAYTSSTSEIRNVGLVNVNVTGQANTGSLVGRAEGRVYASWATGTGSVTGTSNVGGLVGHTRENAQSVVAASYSTIAVSANGNNMGGLVGRNDGGAIIASYATGSVSGSATSTGGLVGTHRRLSGSIVASYSTGSVTASGGTAGGLVGALEQGATRATVTDSYWDTDTSGRYNSAAGSGKTTFELKNRINYADIYSNWDVNVDGIPGGDRPWEFWPSTQYPALQVSFDGHRTIFGPQRAPKAPTVTAVLTDPTTITVTMARSTDASDAGGDPASYEYRYNNGGTTFNAPDWTNVSGTSFQIGDTSLAPRYNFEVRAVNAHGGSPSDATSYTFLTTVDLIEVNSLAKLNAIRYDLNGDGHSDNTADATDYSTAFGTPACAEDGPATSTCSGYKLTADLDFGHGAQVARDVDSQIVAALELGTYTIEATTVRLDAGDTGDFTLSVSGLGGGPATLTPIDTDADDCRETLTGDGSVSGTWAAGTPEAPACLSETNSRGATAMDTGYQVGDPIYTYARYYTFTLTQPSEVIINLEGQVPNRRDPYLYLRAGDARSGEQGDPQFIEDNDDVGPRPYWNNGAGWNPIGEYTGVFEGDGKSITNLYINRTSTDDVGLFSATGASAKIRNLALANVAVWGKDNVGALVGRSEGTILRVYSTGPVRGNNRLGGLVGNLTGSITASWSHALVSVPGFPYLGANPPPAAPSAAL